MRERISPYLFVYGSVWVCVRGVFLCGHHKNILAAHILLLWYTAVNMQ